MTDVWRTTATINQHKYGQSDYYSSSGKPPTSYGSSYNGNYGGGYYGGYRGRGRGRGVVSSGPHKQYVRPGLVSAGSSSSADAVGKGKEKAAAVVGVSESGAGTSGESEEKVKAVGVGKKEVIIGGVAFEASKRSLVRKDCTFFLLAFVAM